MRPHLLGWAQVPTQALACFVALAVALVQVRQELAGFRLLLAMSRSAGSSAPWGLGWHWLKPSTLVAEVHSMAPLLFSTGEPASRA